MLILKRLSDLRRVLDARSGRIGFVPTMGALHEGHLSLVRRSVEENPFTVVSIFVNPTQFNDKCDFDLYPSTPARDAEGLLAAGADILYMPEVSEMYPNGTSTGEQYPIGYLDTVLDGAFRPGHFNGVSLIVHRLLMHVKPTHLYMGEKDFQQCLVVKQLIGQQQLPVELIICPTLREAGGLAMSSRNERLSAEARETASAIYRNLQVVKEGLNRGEEFSALQQQALQALQEAGLEPEYLQLADALTLELLPAADPQRPMVLLIAARLEGVRLIDNLRV